LVSYFRSGKSVFHCKRTERTHNDSFPIVRKCDNKKFRKTQFERKSLKGLSLNYTPFRKIGFLSRKVSSFETLYQKSFLNQEDFRIFHMTEHNLFDR
jgi:hypothetical protein